MANVPFQLRCERQTKWKNGAPNVQQNEMDMCMVNIVDSVCWHLIIYKSICKVNALAVAADAAAGYGDIRVLYYVHESL